MDKRLKRPKKLKRLDRQNNFTRNLTKGENYYGGDRN